MSAAGGQALMVTLTAPGAATLPWDPTRCRVRGRHVHSGRLGCVVRAEAAEAWNAECLTAFSRLHARAVEYARRRHGVGSRLLAKAPEVQRRGVLHLHVVVDAKSAADLAAGTTYARRLAELARSSGFGGQVEIGRWGPAAGTGAYLAKYVSKTDGVRSLWESGALEARAFYVAARVTRETGVTIRTLRRRGSWWAQGVAVSLGAVRELREYEDAFDRPLTPGEVVCLPGVSWRGPPA